MQIRLSDHFTYRRLLRFTLPPIVMMIFTSIYSMIDGFFVSNFVGITPFAAVNLIYPVPTILGAVGFMIGSGGSALVSKTLGEGRNGDANRVFSLLVWAGLAVGIILSALGFAFLRPIALLLGADEAMLPYCLIYGRFLLAALPCFLLQMMFQSFLVTAERPRLGLAVTVSAGLTNVALDALFVAGFRWGLVGAALATTLAQAVGGLVPLVYFLRPNGSLLRLGRPARSLGALLRACGNGSSELVANVSMSLVSILYNFQLMRLTGENGVAAYGAVMYVGFLFVAVFFGYSTGVSPVIGFHFGARDHDELRGLFRKSLVVILSAGTILAVLAFALADPLARLYVGARPELRAMTADAFRAFAVSVLFIGFNVFGSAFFTALNNGAVSGVISFLRTFLFQVAAVLLLPIPFGLDGVWYSLFAGEVVSSVVVIVFLVANRRRYRY